MANMIADALGGMLSKVTNGTNSTAIGDALRIYSSVKGSQNPMDALKAMSSMNPNIAKAMDIVNQNGGDPRSAFMKLAEQSGIDPNTILSLIK